MMTYICETIVQIRWIKDFDDFWNKALEKGILFSPLAKFGEQSEQKR